MTELKEKIPIDTLRSEREWISLLVLNALGLPTERTEPIFAAANADEGLTISILINGIEFSAKPFLDSLEAQHSKMVQTEAAQMLETRLSDLSNQLSSVESAVRDSVREAFPDLDHDFY